MSRLEILVAGLVCGLVVSLGVNVFVLIELRELRLSYRELSQSYDELWQSYEKLREMLVGQPPISKSQAIDIALEYGGWNETMIKDMKVTAGLNYVMFQNTSYSRGYGIMILHDVTGYVSDYSPKETCFSRNHYFYECIAHRYVWIVVVQKKGFHTIPPPGYYYVDAATSEVLSHDDTLLGRPWSTQP